jgi:hypothetical protein
MGGQKAPLKRRGPAQTIKVGIAEDKSGLLIVDTGIYRHVEFLHSGVKLYDNDDAPSDVESVDQLIDKLNISDGSETRVHWAGVAKSRLNIVRQFLESDPDLGRIVKTAYLAGMAVERVQVCTKEHYALTGKKRRAVTAKGGHGTKKLKDEQTILAVCEMVREEQQPGVSKSAACDRVAARIRRKERLPDGVKLPDDVSWRTVYRAFDEQDNA